MRKIAWNGDISLIGCFAASGMQAIKQMRIAVCTSVVFVAGIQRAAAQRNAEDAVGAACYLRFVSSSRSPFGKERTAHHGCRTNQKLSAFHGS